MWNKIIHCARMEIGIFRGTVFIVIFFVIATVVLLCSLNRNEVSVIFTIHGKKGRDISSISEFNGKFVDMNQYEVLFATDTRFEIVSVSEHISKIYIELKEL